MYPAGKSRKSRRTLPVLLSLLIADPINLYGGVYRTRRSRDRIPVSRFHCRETADKGRHPFKLGYGSRLGSPLRLRRTWRKTWSCRVDYPREKRFHRSENRRPVAEIFPLLSGRNSLLPIFSILFISHGGRRETPNIILIIIFFFWAH